MTSLPDHAGRHVWSPRRRAVVVLVASGAMGWFLGAVLGPRWQDAIEPAQVLAGLVQYPADNPVYLYSTRVWTLLHQIPALLLAAGVSERALTFALSGLMGMVSFQALAVLVLALSGDLWLAIVAPFFVFAADPGWDGVNYPVVMLGSPFTYGVLALSLAVLVFACFGAGLEGLGLLLLAVLPAVHVTAGVWCAAVVVMGAALTWRHSWPRLHEARWWFAAGLTVTAVSFIVQWLWVVPAVPIDRAEAARYLDVMLTYWDEHRRPVNWSADVMTLNYSTVALAAVWLWRPRDLLPHRARFLLLCLAISAVLGGAVMALAAWAPVSLPAMVIAAMPSRLLNVSVLAGFAVIVGLAGRSRTSLWCQAVLASFVVLLCLPRIGAPSAEPSHDGYEVARAASIALLLWAIVRPGWPDRAITSFAAGAMRFLRVGAVTAPAVLFVVTAVHAIRQCDATVLEHLPDSSTDQLYGMTAMQPGLLLTASNLHRIQLVTRRPVLLDGGAIDGLAYVPEAGPATERILKEVYGTSLFASAARPHEGTGYLPDATGRVVWEGRSVADWQNIRQRFGVTGVLTFGDWRLQLPRVQSGRGLVLWWIP